MTESRFIESGDGLEVLPPGSVSARLKALQKRLDAIAKEGEGSGPTADAVHVPSTRWGKPPSKKLKPAKAKAKV